MNTHRFKFLFFTQLLIRVALLSRCPKISFTKLLVQVEEKDFKSTYTVRGCLSSHNIRYTNLKYIRVRDQNIPVLKKGFVNNISANFTLQINYNNLSIVEEEAFLNLPNLQEIDLDHNGIEWVETNVFSDMYELSAVDLSYNKIEQLLQNTFNNLSNLVILSISNNHLKAFRQDWFYQVPKLEILYLEHNHITILPRFAFQTLSSIQHISLSYNHINYIHKFAFEGLKLLVELLLDHNSLKKLDVNFKVTKLGFLSLHNNNITYISDSSLTGLEKFASSVWIHANPWQCGCFDKVIEWGLKTNTKISWKCENTELYCILPKDKPDECIERTDDEFYSKQFEEFQQYCDKVLI